MVQESIIHRIESLKEELAALQPLSKEAEDALWKKLRLEWNYNSNHIEGNTLTYGETKLLLMFEKTTGDHSKREYDEMEAHDAAVLMVQEWAQDKSRSLTESDIRELNKVILVKPFWKEAITPDGQSTRRKIKIGDYKEHPNSVRLPNGEMFQYAKPEEVPIKMQELMDWYRSSSDLDPVILAAELHYRFIRIHPFDDGNGRVARLLVNYVLMLNDLPPVVIKSAEKEKYLTALQKADVGDRDAFHSYMAEQLIWSLELSIKAAKGEDLEEDDDWKKEAAQLERSLKNRPKVIHKSDDVVRDKMETIYRPFLNALKKELSYVDRFFRNATWHLPFRKERLESNIDVIVTLTEPSDLPETFEQAMQKIFSSFKEGYYKHHKLIRNYEFFNNDDDGFEMTVIVDISFKQAEFEINTQIGNEVELTKIGKSLRQIFNDQSEPKPVEITVASVNYNQAVDSEQIRSWANLTGKLAYNWMIEKKTSIEERKNRES